MEYNEDLIQKVKDLHFDDANEYYNEGRKNHLVHAMLEFIARQTVKSGEKINALMKDEDAAVIGGGRSEAEAIGFNKGLRAALEVLGL